MDAPTHTYVVTMFTLGLIALLIRLIAIAVIDWPYEFKKPKTLGGIVAETILGLALTLWAGILLCI